MERHDIKLRRLEKACLQTISEAIVSRVDDRRLRESYLTLTRISISGDLQHALVYYTLPDPSRRVVVQRALQSAAPLFFSILKNRIKIRIIPHLQFRYDEKREAADRVVDLIEKLGRDEDPTETDE